MQQSYVHDTFSQNKTIQWINMKTLEEQTELLRNARQSTQHTRDKFRHCKEEIEERKQAEINKKISDGEATAHRQIQMKEKHISDVITFGLWQTKEDVDNQVESYITKCNADKLEALQSQQRFYKAVVEQRVPTKDCIVFTKVQEGKRLPIAVVEWTNNLKQLLDSAAYNLMFLLNILIHRRGSTNSSMPLMTVKNGTTGRYYCRSNIKYCMIRFMFN